MSDEKRFNYQKNRIATLRSEGVYYIGSSSVSQGIFEYYQQCMVECFSEIFKSTDVEAALAAGIFHRKDVPIADVKEHLQDEDLEIR